MMIFQAGPNALGFARTKYAFSRSDCCDTEAECRGHDAAGEKL